MQVLKDTVRDKIIASARRLFAKCGFRETSMRMIAKETGITAGNIYRYFDTKEQILDVVLSPLLEHIQKIICDHDKEENTLTFDVHRAYHNFVARSLVEIYHSHRQEYVILLRKAAGTPYENYYENLVAEIGRTMADFNSSSLIRMPISNPEIYYILARNHVDALIYALEHVEEPDRMEQVIKEYLDLQFNLIYTPKEGGESQ